VHKSKLASGRFGWGLLTEPPMFHTAFICSTYQFLAHDRLNTNYKAH
jgi:hypothetical protein